MTSLIRKSTIGRSTLRRAARRPHRAARRRHRRRSRCAARRPALRAIEQPVGDAGVESGRAREASRLVARELQLRAGGTRRARRVRAAARAPAAARRGWSAPRSSARHSLHGEVEEAEERGIVDTVHVVEHDDPVRYLAGVERVDDLGRDRALLVRRPRPARAARPFGRDCATAGRTARAPRSCIRAAGAGRRRRRPAIQAAALPGGSRATSSAISVVLP